MPLSPTLAVHMSLALTAVATGPVALWARLGTAPRPRLQRLDPQLFWQIHRGSVVRATAIESVSRDESGRLSLRLKGHPERLAVSRLHAHLFKAM